MRRLIFAAAMMVALAAACKKEDRAATNINAANRVAVRLVRLYYEGPQMLLLAEPRNIALPESPAAALPVVVRELLKGPAVATSLRLLPPDTVLRGAYLLPGGVAIIDLGGPTLTAGWSVGSHLELMAAYSLVHTASANFREVREVRLLVNGSPAETLGGHVALTMPLLPRPALVEPRAR